MIKGVAASEIQKNFGLWHDKALKEPVQITKYGRETAYLISAEAFHELWTSFRRAVHVRDLTDREMDMIRNAKVPEEHDYDYTDDEEPSSDHNMKP